MVKKNIEETSLDSIKINRGDGSLEDVDKNSMRENGEDKVDDDDEENHIKRKRKVKSKQHRFSNESEYNNDNDSNNDQFEREREESIAIPIEEEEVLDVADDATDGKGRTQRQANTYAAKKTVAQGMMDIALITANANQLRYIIEFNRNSSTFFVNVFLIVLSLFLQVGVGVSLIFKGRMDLRGQSKHRYAKRINNYVVVGVFLVTIINVFIASFTITGSDASMPLNYKGDGQAVKI